MDNLIPHIKRLSLVRTNPYHPQFLTLLLPMCHRLRVINFIGDLPLQSNQLGKLIENNHSSLREINFTNLSNSTLTAASIQPILLDKCHRLHTLKISRCQWLTDGSLECFLLHLKRNSLQQARQHSLRVLDLSSCPQISTRILNLFVKSRCLHLTSLNLSNLLAAVQDETLFDISNNSMGATIEFLNLINCSYVTGSGLR